MDKKLKQWREDGKHYPPILRDFHDQKDIFKLIHRLINVEGHSYCGDVDWVKGQCYVIDIFLWAMAQFGYTLQKSRAKLNFDNLEDFIKAHKEEMIKQFNKILEDEQQPEICPHCDGSGEGKSMIVCPLCKGSGEIK